MIVSVTICAYFFDSDIIGNFLKEFEK